MRLFLITFAGTVAANVVTVIVVAIAIILDRHPASERPSTSGVLLYFLAGAVLGIFGIGSGLTVLRKRPKIDLIPPKVRVVIAAYMLCSGGLFALITLLFLLGYAVGVK